MNAATERSDNLVHPPAHGNTMLKWPYPIRYHVENVVETDILIVGGGLAGACAAIEAARRGARTVLVDKAPIKRSGNGGAGIDHWREALTNPCSRITPEEYIEEMEPASMSFQFVQYIAAKRSYETLLEIEKMGLQFRDVDDEFKGAPFRDDETKILFAYDYTNRFDIKLRGGHNLKPVLYNELKRSSVPLFERVMVTSLLTEGGRQGGRVLGATGVNIQTGEFYVFEAKATILAAGSASGIWIFSTELIGGAAEHDDPNNTGDAFAMAWNAGAKFTLMYRGGKVTTAGGFAWPDFGAGCPDNTWFPCSIVDAEGKEIPWQDASGKMLTTVEERNHPAAGQKYFTTHLNNNKKSHKPHLISDLPERIRRGEYNLPLYADLPGMPEQERRSIWGLMVGNEGKTRFPIYHLYTQAGFNPDKDMLQCPMMNPDSYGGDGYYAWFHGDRSICSAWRRAGGAGCIGGPVLNWDLMTSLPGLFAAGQFAMGDGAASACVTGRYAAAAAVRYIRDIGPSAVDSEQVRREKERVYAPLKRNDAFIGWKELAAGICRIMQCYCGDYKTDIILRMGLEWMKSIRESELSKTYARNPHELVRVLQCESRITVAEMFLQGCLSKYLSDRKGVKNRFIVDQLVDGEVRTTELESEFWLKRPNEDTYLANFRKHSGI